MATVPPNGDDVDQILTRMMEVNSPLQKQARTQGLQQAQQVGLGQSTMGIKAAQAAAYNAAVPIASQQAQQVHQAKQQTAQFGHETGMQTRGFEHAASQAALDRQQQLTAQEQAAYWDRLKTHEVISREQAFQGQQSALQRSMQERFAAMDLTAADRERALNALSNANTAWNSAISQITANPELPADARNYYITLASQARDHQSNVIASMMRAGGVAW
jgi:hypothetical protein